MTSTAEPRSYRLKDKLDDVEFVGEQIAFATTETATSTRWTEVTIYRTIGQQYVIQRVGRSVLYHLHDGVCNTGIPTAYADIPQGDEDLVPCDRCNPPDVDDLEIDELVDLELDRYNVDICQADEVATKLQLSRPDGSTFMSQVAGRALAQALAADPALRQSVTVRKVQ